MAVNEIYCGNNFKIYVYVYFVFTFYTCIYMYSLICIFNRAVNLKIIQCFMSITSQ